MIKSFIFLLIAVSLFISLGLSPDTEARENQSATNTTNLFPKDNVDIITLSDSEVFIPCKIGYVPTESCPDRTIINVGVKGNNRPDGGENEIKYKVSGGRIIGKGSLVQWDFSDVRKAGYYNITVEFVDFNNKKQTKTETITLRSCDCLNDCICPKISVTASADPVKAGKIVTFTAKIINDLEKKVVYSWTISVGEIIEGQGTSQIKVKTTREMFDTNLTAVVEISGDEICFSCENPHSETISIIK